MILRVVCIMWLASLTSYPCNCALNSELWRKGISSMLLYNILPIKYGVDVNYQTKFLILTEKSSALNPICVILLYTLEEAFCSPTNKVHHHLIELLKITPRT